MSHQCRACGALSFDNHPHGPLPCATCGDVDAGTIDTFDEPEHDDQEDPDDAPTTED